METKGFSNENPKLCQPLDGSGDLTPKTQGFIGVGKPNPAKGTSVPTQSPFGIDMVADSTIGFAPEALDPTYISPPEHLLGYPPVSDSAPGVAPHGTIEPPQARPGPQDASGGSSSNLPDPSQLFLKESAAAFAFRLQAPPVPLKKPVFPSGLGTHSHRMTLRNRSKSATASSASASSEGDGSGAQKSTLKAKRRGHTTPPRNLVPPSLLSYLLLPQSPRDSPMRTNPWSLGTTSSL